MKYKEEGYHGVGARGEAVGEETSHSRRQVVRTDLATVGKLVDHLTVYCMHVLLQIYISSGQ